MVKEQKRDVMGKIYRQFSRQKYNKYKHQYPKMRESQIVSKIIREWDSLDLGAKQKLKKQYQQNKILTTEDFSQSQTAKKIDQIKRLQKETTAKKNEVAQDQPILIQEVKVTKLQQKFEENKQLKTKKQSKQKNTTFKFRPTDYITFFRHYYQKHRQEHPRWTSSQISKIIRLMWKKNKAQKQGSSKIKKQRILMKAAKVKKIVSGLAAFKKFKSLNSSSATKLWKHLPIQSKKYWEIQAQGKKRQAIRQQKITLKGCMEQDLKPFDFLNKVIR